MKLTPYLSTCPLCGGNGCNACDETGIDDGGPPFFEPDEDEPEEDDDEDT